MNDKIIEEILFKAPRPLAPADLSKQIQAEIALPTAKAAPKARDWQNPLRRWFPALAFAVLLLSCAVMIAVQASWSTDLKIQNDVLRAATADLPKLRERHAVLEQAQASQDELAQLRKDNDELHQLQKEAAQLRNLPAQIQQLQSDNKRLAAAPAPASNAASSAAFFVDAEADAERIRCVNNLKQIGLAMRVWAQDNNDQYPTSIVDASNELSTVKVLICPGDKARQPYGLLNFQQFQNNMSSYQFTVKPDDETHPDCITARCPIHHNYLMADGSVQQVNPEKIQEVQKDGRWYLQNIQTGEPTIRVIQK